jgi:hypothetical protein
MFNIPAPGAPGEALLKGFDTGSSHMARLLQNKIQQAQMQQAQNQFMQNFGLQQAQENRLQQLFPAQMQNTLAQAQMHQAQAGQLAQEQQMLQMMMSGMNGGSVPQFNSGQNFTSNQPPVQNSLPMNQGQDIYKPNNQAQPLGQVNPIQGPNVSPNALQNNVSRAVTGQKDQFADLKQNPYLASYFKSKFGIDLNAETREQTAQRELKEFADKENLKNIIDQSKPGTILTPAMQSKVQEQIFEIQKVKPELVKLRYMDPQKITYFQSNKDKAYESALFHIADSLVKAKDLPRTNHSIDEMKKSLRMGANEDVDKWQERIDHLLEELDEREGKGLTLLSNKQTEQSPDYAALKAKFEKTTPAKITSTKEYMKTLLNGIDKYGKKVKVKPEDKAAFLADGGKIS